MCVGTSIVGTSCDDNNTNTENDVYDTNGICVGTPINTLTKVDIFNDGSGVALYTFDNHANDSGNRYNGYTVGSVSFVSGKFNQAASFNDAGSINTNWKPNLPERSISVWFSSTDTSGYIISTAGRGGEYGFGIYHNGTNSIAPFTQIGNTNPYNQQYTHNAGFNHLVLNIKSGKTNVYINGVKQIESNATFTLPQDTNNLRFGQFAGNGYNLTGLIDQARIFNRILTQEEVTQLYNEH